MKELYIGTSGWSYNHWREVFYPSGLSQPKWLSFYAEHFNSVEINMTFYRKPTEKAMLGWMEKTPPGFGFTLKAPRIITHIKRLNEINDSLFEFYNTISFMKDRVKCILFQFPASFHMTPENYTRLKYLLKISETGTDLAFEFRDKSWWHSDVYDLLDEKGIFCTVSGFDMPSHIIISGSSAYVRFHGENYSTFYSGVFLKTFVEKLKKHEKFIKLDCLYVYFNNDTAGYAIKNALFLKEILNS